MRSRYGLSAGLPQKPVSRNIDLDHFGSSLTQMAVSNDGTLLVYAVVEGERESLYSWTPSSERARFLTSAALCRRYVRFANGAAIVADRGANEVFAVWDAGGSAVRQFLLGVQDGVLNPAGVAICGTVGSTSRTLVRTR